LSLISPADRPVGKTTKASAKPQTVNLSEVAELPLILPSRPNAFRILIEAELMAVGRRPNVILEVDGLNAILSLVKEGMGHAVLPSYTLSNFENASPFAVKTIQSPSIKSQLMLVWSSRRPTTQTQKKAMEIVKQVVLKAIEAV
jgi:LysR family nitrogen assimilation transcriptional regulator